MRLSVCALVAACLLLAGSGVVRADSFDRTEHGRLASFQSEEPQVRQSADSRRGRARRGARTARAADFDSGRSSLGAGSVRISGLGPRPRRWCGWWMRSQRGGGPEFNVAWNWRKYGQPSGPQIGAVVVWRHHVGEIVGRAANGMWIVRSGNDGGRVRTRARSVAGAIFRI